MTTSTDWDRGLVLEGVVGRSSLAVGLVDLVRLRVVVGSPSASVLLGRADLGGLDFLDALVDGAQARAAVGLLQSGTIDAYEAHRAFVDERGEERAITVWMRGLARDGFGDWALAILRATEDVEGPGGGLARDLAVHSAMAVGAGGIDRGVDRLSSEIESLLGITSSPLCAQPFETWVHPTETTMLTSALQRSQASGAPEVVTARLRTRSGDWERFRIVLKVSADPRESRVGVAVLPGDQGARERAADTAGVGLAAEIRALDLVDAMTYLPARGALAKFATLLSEREWEIIARLLRGDRVPAIAAALYLAPSTVRNHLVSVFRKAGVNSQQELISLLRKELGS